MRSLEEAQYPETPSILAVITDALLGEAADRDKDGGVAVEELLAHIERATPRRSTIFRVGERADTRWWVARAVDRSDVVVTPETVEQYKKVVAGWRVDGLLATWTSYALYYLLDQVAGKTREAVNKDCLDLYLKVDPHLARASYRSPTEQFLETSKLRGSIKGSDESTAQMLERIIREEKSACLGSGKK